MLEHKLWPASNVRAFTPTSAESDGPGIRGNLANESTGDWSYKPHRYEDGKGRGAFRFFVTGPRCSCSLAAPVGTFCARHRN
jgi:hypothetical protein